MSFVNAVVAVEALALFTLAFVFCFQGQWRLGIAQALYGVPTIIIFSR